MSRLLLNDVLALSIKIKNLKVARAALFVE